MDEKLELKELYVKGSIIGLLVGDALGYHYRDAKYNPPQHINDIDMYPGPQEYRHEGTYTNSSALAICTMATFNESDSMNIEDMMERFYDCVIGGYMNYDAEDYYIGAVAAQSIKNFSNGMPWDKCGIRTEKADEEDDVLLRILPVALWFVNDKDDKFIEEMQKVCQITHNTIKSQVCCSLYGLIVRNLLLQKPEKVFDLLDKYYQENEKSEYTAVLHEIRKSSNNDQISVSSGKPITNIVTTFWSAWKTFSSNQNNFKNAVRKSTRFPNPNVVAGITGSWVALQTGLNDIPFTWLKTLKLTGETMETIETFVHKVIKRY